MIRTEVKYGLILVAFLVVSAPGGQKASAEPARHDSSRHSGDLAGEQAGKPGVNSTRPKSDATPKAGRAATPGDTKVSGNGAPGQPVLAGVDSAGGGAGQAHVLDTSKEGIQPQTARPAGPIVTFPDASIRWMMASGATVLLGALLFMLDRLRRQADAGMEMKRPNERGGHS